MLTWMSEGAGCIWRSNVSFVSSLRREKGGRSIQDLVRLRRPALLEDHRRKTHY